MSKLWNIATGSRLQTLIERSQVNISLPLANGVDAEIELISGSIPTGTRLENNTITGTVYEVAYDTIFSAVFRATTDSGFQDCTIEFVVTGPDSPTWQTNAGLLSVGSNNALFILDNEIIDYQLVATDTDLSAGDELSYFIADGDGVLPIGITLSDTGKLQGTTEPLISLDKRNVGGGYDSSTYAGVPMDYTVLSSNGYSSFYYDTVDFDYSEATANLRKLNRYYPFAVTVTDGENFERREFKIYLVGDDYLKSDNTVMQASTGVFTADNTSVRTPVWITPKDLGFKRANNYTTIYLEIIDNWTLEGVVVYTLEDVNDDLTPSELPPGMTLDSQTGEVIGRIPYQPAVTQNYKFTVKATRITTDLETLTIFANFYEDILLGNNSFKINKINLTGDIDGINDLFELVGKKILLGTRQYTVTNVDARNTAYDTIFVQETLAPSINLLVSQTATAGQDHFFVSRLLESDKSKYAGRTLKFSNSEAYTINTFTPYIEWQVTQTTSEDPFLPAASPRIIELGTNYYIGDFIINDVLTGGDGKIYKCTTAHTASAQVDEFGNNILVNDIIQLNFIGANWLEVAETLEGLSISDRVIATKQALEEEYNGTAYITVVDNLNWRIRVPSTAYSRIKSNIQSFFSGADSSDVIATLIRDNEDKVTISTNLSSQLNNGRNIGIALFAKDGFFKNIIVASSDAIDIPSTAKTFEVRVIGEIDSAIKWITPVDLGTINANFTSTLKLIAETTVPDTAMLYSIKSGKLPFGLMLNYDGEIIGAARQFGTPDKPGLTIFENVAVTWDGAISGDTTFDRSYKFTVEARDRFNYTAIEREFKLDVVDLNRTQYTDIYMRPMLSTDQRKYYKDFVSNPEVFTPSKIYRPSDSTFGVQKTLDMLVYAGVEATTMNKFVAAAAKGHKRKKYILGNIKSAVAKLSATSDTIYEVIYIDVKDPANSTVADTKTVTSFKTSSKEKITVDSIQYAAVDDATRFKAGYNELAVGTRAIVRFVVSQLDEITIDTRAPAEEELNVDNQDFEVTVRAGGTVLVELQKSDSEAYRFRPKTNTIKSDSNIINVSQSTDSIKYISSIDNMRANIKTIGDEERNYLPLWMRTAQTGFQELDYVTAIPICYCKPGESATIINNIKRYGFDPKTINYDIDRYIVKQTENSDVEKFVLFANYQFNV
tara:strand:- start:100 stop:3612 length:3513 start_codon:yes stop_codon:yes gene_type:complete